MSAAGRSGLSNLLRGCRGVGGFSRIFGAVVKWKNEFKVVLCQILNWLNSGSYPGRRIFK
jgi:hypothetical protein